MADSLLDILKEKSFDEPPEIAAIKKYVKDHFDEIVEVVVREHNITITAASAGLVATLRFHIRHIQKAAQTDKRLVLRIR